MTARHNDAPDCAGRNVAQAHGKHTPGPWQVRNGCNVFATNEDGSLEYLAVTGGLSGRDTIDRDAANARLIAAAPELLEALNDTRKKLVRGTSLAELLPALDAAIAKAEGRS